MNYNLQCERGNLSFGCSDGSTLWLVQGKRLWLHSPADGIRCIEFDPQVKEVGKWPPSETKGDFGGMPDSVRRALKLTKAEQTGGKSN